MYSCGAECGGNTGVLFCRAGLSEKVKGPFKKNAFYTERERESWGGGGLAGVIAFRGVIDNAKSTSAVALKGLIRQ